MQWKQVDTLPQRSARERPLGSCVNSLAVFPLALAAGIRPTGDSEEELEPTSIPLRSMPSQAKVGNFLAPLARRVRASLQVGPSSVNFCNLHVAGPPGG